ncbi:NAD-dependent succinate-semialdehyde dehydrogenase [Sanguibacter sp. HDW7]|uniref:NAD-dependent succinate-semialdehyde dehydrogenase n=1 Tax=Sanguibacter sp. HDW7 TaxID=2714931 RepID=UPI00140EB5CE|nr:NAD-dependent succinate-semialdehyde dehydrogenase [Sanguibacter sp. HDW7]QIK83265.1 NAD-dependent succinate-semialdehyde dehydrogenase [Sanguibacter sp. HDW7]
MAPTTQLPHDLPTGSLVGGAWLPASSTFEVHDPATGDVLAEVADADGATALAALDAAAEAAPAWRATSPRARADVLHDVHRTLLARGEEIAALITSEGGKPLAESRAELDYGADYVRWYAEQAVRVDGLVRTAPAGGVRQIVSRRPVGPSLLVTPWNFPLAMIARKVAPALAAGCTVVVKPARLTPLTTLLVAEVVRTTLAAHGLPTGVLNVVTGTSASALVDPLLADHRLRKLSFTGSTEVGRTLLAGAAQGIVRTSMELGGNAPFLVCDDADLDLAVTSLLQAKMRNSGQTCVAANRIYAQDGIADELTARLTDAFARLVVGPGSRDGVTVGPLIEASAADSMEQTVAAALADGARVTTGGDRPGGPGHFFAPTILADVPADSAVLRGEIFGPVAPVTRFGTLDEGITLANDTDAGLVAYAHTRDLHAAMRLADELEAGMIGLNRGMVSDASAPFGGVKMSGLGREGGEAGLEEYLETVYVAL